MNEEKSASPPEGETFEHRLLRGQSFFRRRLFFLYAPAAMALFLLLELLFLAFIWPDWEAWRRGDVSPSALIEDYKAERVDDPKLPPLRWSPVARSFPRSVRRVFVLAEDSRFYEHAGIDIEAIIQAVEYNFRHGRILLGASTISQQTAKNMFLSLSRSPLRKWHELLLTYLLEAQLTKDQILHVYLNVAEFGPGVFGLEAAARHYYKTSAQGLGLSQAIELAATLPSPKKNNPATRTKTFQKRVQRIGQTLQVVDRVAAEGARPSARRRELQKNLEELQRELKENPPEPVPAPEAIGSEPASDASRGGEDLEAVEPSTGEAVSPVPPEEAPPPPPEAEAAPSPPEEPLTPPPPPEAEAAPSPPEEPLTPPPPSGESEDSTP